MIRTPFKKLLLAVLLMSWLMPGEARASDLEPRSYINMPVDQSFVSIAYGYSVGDVNVNPSIPLKDASVRIHGPVFTYMRTLDIAGNTARFDVSLPYTCVSGSAMNSGQRLSGKVCGQGDTQARLIYNFYGAPALELKDFVRQRKAVVVGASLQVGVPTGQYDMNSLLNIGTNRWFIEPEIGASFPWRSFSVEVAAGVNIYGDNDAYIGGVTLKQDPLYNLQAHFTYDFSPKKWISFSGNYYFGGITYENGVKASEMQKKSRLAVIYSAALDKRNVLRLSVSKGVLPYRQTGNDSTNLGIAWFYLWE
jgi:hypothetical protein